MTVLRSVTTIAFFGIAWPVHPGQSACLARFILTWFLSTVGDSLTMAYQSLAPRVHGHENRFQFPPQFCKRVIHAGRNLLIHLAVDNARFFEFAELPS